MAEDILLGHYFGFLHHRLQLLDKDVSVESACDLVPESVDGGEDHFALGLLEKLWQRPGPFKPIVQDLYLFAVIGRDDVTHGPDVAAGVDPDCLA